MHVDLLNMDQTAFPWFWGMLAVAAITAFLVILFWKKEAVRNWSLAVGAALIVMGFVGVIVTSTIVRETNWSTLTKAINTTYHLKLSERQQSDLYARGSGLIVGQPTVGKYGTTTLERAHAFVDVSLYYQDGDFFLGTVGTGKVTPLPIS